MLALDPKKICHPCYRMASTELIGHTDTSTITEVDFYIDIYMYILFASNIRYLLILNTHM